MRTNLFNVFKLGIVSISAFGILLGCEQDPLAKYPDNIKNGLPPDKKPEKKKNVPKDAMVLEMSPQVASFIEGQNGKLLFTGRLLGYTDVESQVRLTNLPDGAVFDQATGILDWTPGLDTIVGGETFATVNITAQMVALTEPPMLIEETFPVMVFRNATVPVIRSVSSINDVTENDRKEFTIAVLDDSSPASKNIPAKAPVISFLNTGSGNDGVQFVKTNGMPSQDTTNPARWVYRYYIDLFEREVTKDKQEFDFNIQVTNRFGEESQPQRVRFLVLTDTSYPVITWAEQTAEVQVGQKYSSHFSVFSEKGDGEMLAEFKVGTGGYAYDTCDKLPGDVTCSCNQKGMYDTDVLECEFSWTPGNEAAGTDYTISILATNQNKTNKSLTKTLGTNNTIKVSAKRGAK